MHLQLLAISDTHLGEDTSVLSFTHGRQRVWQALRDIFGNGERFDVDEFIFIGDIPDRTLSSTAQIITHTNAFVQMLGSAANIGKGVYLPGNHDHTLWTNYIKNKYRLDDKISDPRGELLVRDGAILDKKEWAEELLTIFFGYPRGSSWRAIEANKNFSFAVANPLYVKELNGRTYVFTHGTHFRWDVAAPEWMKKIADYIQADKVAGIEIDSVCDVSEAKNMADLEKTITGFVDTLWPSSKDNPSSQSDRLWYFLTLLSGKFSHKRESPPTDKLYAWSDLPNAPKKQLNKLVEKNEFKDGSLKRWQQYFLPHMIPYLAEHNIPTDQMTFVYGDTHKGGWGEYIDDGRQMHIINTGGWGTHNKEEHPACHLFALDSEGNEYLLDISFRNVHVLGEPLLDLAAKDTENRYNNTSFLFRMVLELLEAARGKAG